MLRDAIEKLEKIRDFCDPSAAIRILVDEAVQIIDDNADSCDSCHSNYMKMLTYSEQVSDLEAEIEELEASLEEAEA